LISLHKFYLFIYLFIYLSQKQKAWMGVTGDTIAGEEIIVKVRYMLIIIPDLIIIVCLIVFTYILTKISSLHESVNLIYFLFFILFIQIFFILSHFLTKKKEKLFRKKLWKKIKNFECCTHDWFLVSNSLLSLLLFVFIHPNF